MKSLSENMIVLYFRISSEYCKNFVKAFLDNEYRTLIYYRKDYVKIDFTRLLSLTDDEIVQLKNILENILKELQNIS